MNPLRIGTRDSELALWQANKVKGLLSDHGVVSELVLIKSEGDIDLQTPLYEMGVQGIFTRSLDAALLNNRIDLAVHSMKDVPTVLPAGIRQCAVLKRGNHRDLLVHKSEWNHDDKRSPAIIATSSIRRRAQWLHRYPQDEIVNLRGNVNTRLAKLESNSWSGAIFAAAGLERISKRPESSFYLEWMLPAPAQGAIMVACRDNDQLSIDNCAPLNDAETEICTGIERSFLRALMGGCSMPISAYAELNGNQIFFRGNILSTDGRKKVEIEKYLPLDNVEDAGKLIAEELLLKGGREMVKELRSKN